MELESYMINTILNKILEIIFSLLYWIREASGGVLENYLGWFQIVGGLLSFVLLWLVIDLIIKTEYFEDRADKKADMRRELAKRKFMLGWDKVRGKLLSDDRKDWQEAITKSSDLLNEGLKVKGYLGIKLDNKLDDLGEDVIFNVAAIKEAQKTIAKITFDPEFSLTQKQAIKLAREYKKAFDQLKLK